MMLFYSSRAPAHMAEGGDDGKRRCVLDVVGAQGLQSYLKGALGAARAEAAAAPPPSGDAHRVRELRAEGFASYVKALSKRLRLEKSRRSCLGTCRGLTPR